MRGLHGRIVYEILPRLAERLKREGLISDYDRKQEKTEISNDFPEIRMNPDLILHTSNGKKILVEVANPKDPKRFIGELVYPKMLLWRKKITAAIVFVLNPQEQETPKRTEPHMRSLSQIIMLNEFLNLPKGSIRVTWPGEDAAYDWLKAFCSKKV
jgi:uncharacterized protein YlzI (FlbEa/FlbD family)